MALSQWPKRWLRVEATGIWFLESIICDDWLNRGQVLSSGQTMSCSDDRNPVYSRLHFRPHQEVLLVLRLPKLDDRMQLIHQQI